MGEAMKCLLAVHAFPPSRTFVIFLISKVALFLSSGRIWAVPPLFSACFSEGTKGPVIPLESFFVVYELPLPPAFTSPIK